MPFLMLRTASVLAAGFLLSGPSTSTHNHIGGTVGGLPTPVVSPCPDHWSQNQLPNPSAPSPAGFDSQIMSIATLSPTDVWMLINGTDSHGNAVSVVYHRTGDEGRESAVLPATGASFGSEWVLARSDSDVWVIGAASKALKAWHYNGSVWTDHRPARYSHAGINAAALGNNGVLYLAGSNGKTAPKGIILSYGGSHWTDLSPANPPNVYKALAVTTSGMLIAGGGDQNDGTLQERSGTTWTTVSLSAPVNSITRVSIAPGGIVYAAGLVAGDQSVLIKQLAGSRSATVFDPSTAGSATTLTSKTAALALGLDVWLLGEGEPHDGWHHPWFAWDDDSAFGAAGRRFAQVGIGDWRSGRHCRHRTAIASDFFPGSSRWGCACHGRSHRHGGAGRSGRGCSGLSLVGKDSGLTW